MEGVNIDKHDIKQTEPISPNVIQCVDPKWQSEQAEQAASDSASTENQQQSLFSPFGFPMRCSSTASFFHSLEC